MTVHNTLKGDKVLHEEGRRATYLHKREHDYVDKKNVCRLKMYISLLLFVLNLIQEYKFTCCKSYL